MSGSFRNIIQVSDKSAHEPATNKILSIGLFPDGFVFAVLDNDAFRYIALEEYFIPALNARNRQTFFLELEQFFRNHPILSESFLKVCFAYFTPQLVLIPECVYDENRKHAYFGFCAEIPNDHQVFVEQMHNLNARGIYVVPDELTCFLEKMFPGYRLKHHGAALIESSLAAQKLEPGDQVDAVVHLRNTHFEILLIDKHQLVYYQTFSYQAFDDVLYYLFYVFEQHKLDASKLHISLTGKLAMDTKEYKTLASFFKIVTFPERNDVFKYSEKFDNIPSHFYHNLLNLVTCG